MSRKDGGVLGLAGIGGTVYLHDLECCAFVKDASEHLEGGHLPVPFSVAALEVVASYSRGAAFSKDEVKLHPDNGAAMETPIALLTR